MNNGFDSESVFYFSEVDFELVLNRVEELNLEIFGIETWQNGEFYNVKSFEEFNLYPSGSNWYRKAFEEFKMENSDLLYAATYGVPSKLLMI